MMMRKLFYSILLIFLLVLVCTVPVLGDQHKYDIGIDWVRRYKIMYGDDKPYCVAERGGYIYVSGFGNSGNIIYVFKISKGSGYVERVWNMRVSGCFAELYDCRFIGEYLYVVGKSCNDLGDEVLLLLVFDSGLNLLLKKEENVTPRSDIFCSLTNDESYLYVVGGINSSDYYGATMWLWRLEKRRLDSLDLVKSFISQRFYGGRPFKVEINPVTNDLWVVGADRRGEASVWIVEIFSRDLAPIKTIDLDLAGRALTLCFDSIGYAYIAGDNAVVKLDPYGGIVSRTYFENYTFSKSICLGDMVFLAGDTLGEGWLVLLDSNLTLLTAKNLHDPTNATRSGFDIGSMAFDGRNIYVAGYEESKAYKGELQWAVYRLYIAKDGNILLLPIQTPRITITSSAPTPLNQYSIALMVVILIAIPIAVLYLRKRIRRRAKRERGSRHIGKAKR